ncbi:MAG: M3 family peptidase [Gammaproteobacteria bacterium]|nr:MAG: M3 family peptidase [Gammaproteobacteria bacterium]
MVGQLPAFSQIDPDGIEAAISRLLDDNRAQLEAILAATGGDGDFATGILPLQALDLRLHAAWAPVNHLHGVSNSPALRAAYNRCLPLITRYETELSQDARVWRLYRRVADSQPDEPAAARLLELALRDFHLAGVDLPAADKKRFGEIAERLAALQARFEQNVLDAMAAWQLPVVDPARLAGLPDAVLGAARDAAAAAGQQGWLLPLDQPSYVAVMTHAEDRDLRRQYYRAWATRASDQPPSPPAFDNSAVIEEILALRHELAGLVGYGNFAEYSLATKMASSVTEVSEFLSELARHSLPAAREELAELERFAGRALAAWDIAFYAEKLRADKYAVSDAELRPFFPLDRVLAGLFALVERIYGLVIEALPEIDAWHPDVRFYRVLDAGGEEIGGFYTDLYARADKRSGAWMDECLLAADFPGYRQLPVAHLVCNFARPTASAPSLLNHDEVLTLFHEFGHTLHHVLTRVPYPAVAGINGVPWDAVELPSQFMENFAWTDEVLPQISGHFRSGQPLPAATLQRLRASRVFHAGMQMVRQLEFALFDLRLHAEFDPRRGSRLARLLEEVRQSVAVVRHPEYNRMAHAFSHIFGGGYAAGYYSYKWAEVLAADAWSAVDNGQGLDTGQARRFRECILEIGGTRDIGAAFQSFRGRPPRLEPLLTQAGILPAAGGE